jgi:hypothetical protein
MWTVRQVQAPMRMRSPSASGWICPAASGWSASLIQVSLALPLSRTTQPSPSGPRSNSHWWWLTAVAGFSGAVSWLACRGGFVRWLAVVVVVSGG